MACEAAVLTTTLGPPPYCILNNFFYEHDELKYVYVYKMYSSFCVSYIYTICHLSPIANPVSVVIDFRRQNVTSKDGPHAEMVNITVGFRVFRLCTAQCSQNEMNRALGHLCAHIG